jgi:hypothetical protein
LIAVDLADKITHPPVGSWVWGSQGIAYQVSDRYRQDGKYWLILATDHGLVEMPLDRVQGWSESPPDFNVVTPIEIQPHRFQWGDRVRYLGKGALSRILRPLLMGKILTVKSIQHTRTEGDWVTCMVPDQLDQTVPSIDLALVGG